jgi:AmmeMemoRadiSam system protein B
MKYYSISLGIVIFLLINFTSCRNLVTATDMNMKTRPLKDTIGFAQYSWQMDSLMSRISLAGWKKSEVIPWKMAICPHDDYTYVGKLYPELLQNVKAPVLILIGVAHSARKLGIRDSLIFDSYVKWKGPWGLVNVSPVREELIRILSKKYAAVNDTLQMVEHSVEALIPYLQYFNRNISIVPILVPTMNPDRMQECGKALAEAIHKVADSHNWKWGLDYAIVATTDAVHYGNEDWGGSDMAYYGCDDNGNMLARDHEAVIIDSCLKGDVTIDKIRLFSDYTLKPPDYVEYKWSWCGRYSVPVALYTSFYLNEGKPIKGVLAGYSTSITSPHIPVDDLRMGVTAIATSCHWVGYAALGYR